MEIPVSRATLSVVLVLVLVFSADAAHYLAFPRMGRSGYLAFPRMGRSETKAETVGDGCCGLGLKGEFAIGQDGKEEQLRNFCPGSDDCCEGLTEVVHQRASGALYALCLPENSPSQNAHTADVFGTLKGLLRRK